MIVKKRLPLTWHSFREKSNFSRTWFRDLKFRILRSRNLASESTQLRVTRFFFLSFISQLRRPIENFHRVLRYTKWENWSLTIFTNSVHFPLNITHQHLIFFSLLIFRLEYWRPRLVHYSHHFTAYIITRAVVFF